MTQEIMNKFFTSDLGQDLNELFTTSDDKVFIRHDEAQGHANGTLEEGTQPLADKKVITWFPEN